ncbi:MAG TPA: group I intron-associated PD-(D/E)XK endonuclease [Terriglobales bacterium]|nr:group I intron-associated PD-(D/E)XK endonuclease [Terriglobales bacterium]
MKKQKSYMPAGDLGTKRMGELAELAFMYRAASEGIGVARPYGDSHAYDFLVQHGRKLARVQVKSCFTKRERRQTGFSILARHRMKKGAGLAYSQEDVDFIAAYVAPYDTWYLIPIEALQGSISIRVHPGLSAERKTRRSGAFYEVYREAWHLLKQPDASETAPNKQNGTNSQATGNAARVP